VQHAADALIAHPAVQGGTEPMGASCPDDLARQFAPIAQALDMAAYRAQGGYATYEALLQDGVAQGQPGSERALAALDDALMRWLRACELAGFDQPVDVVGLRHGWLDALQQPRLEQRFRAGGVTFCTLMPMRAIPFDVVCLLGMNEADYPRRNPRSDFDLMALPGQFRPGDRSRQHDDRQLMLEALLSARRQLIVSWTGRSVRDNSEQPPSVLVSQLRDYIAAVWGTGAVKDRTTEHPLQPFDRRYFDGSDPRLFARVAAIGVGGDAFEHLYPFLEIRQLAPCGFEFSGSAPVCARSERLVALFIGDDSGSCPEGLDDPPDHDRDQCDDGPAAPHASPLSLRSASAGSRPKSLSASISAPR
jgi:hypothetical protein